MSAEAFRQIDEAYNRPWHDLKSANDRPGDIPPDIEAHAIRMFGDSTQGMTGHRWDWEQSDENIRKARLAISPEGIQPSPINRMAFNISKHDS